MKYYNLFIAFFRTGMLAFGGGPSAIPLVYKEVVVKYRWLNDDDFSDIVALGNALPGPINTKLAGYIGYRVGGFLGMLIALIATVFPTVILIIIFLTGLHAFKDEPWVKGISNGVIPVVAAMMAGLTWDFIKKTKNQLSWHITLFLVIVSLIFFQFLSVHPALVILGLLMIALFMKTEKRRENSK